MFFTNSAVAASPLLTPSKASSELSHSLQLDNGLLVNIISDPRATSSAISVNIGAGQRHSPEKYQGLPHLLEHAVLMGSTAFPDSSDWDDFVKSAGGWSNASTRPDNTRYHLQIEHEYLDQSLVRLSDLLFKPLLTVDVVDIGVAEVNEEFLTGKTSEWQRILSVIRATTSTANSAKLFGTGNKASLNGSSQELRLAAQQFHSTYYVPNNMVLVIYTNQNYKQVAKLVSKTFGRLDRGNIPKLQRVDLHDTSLLSTLYKIDAKSANASVDIRFNIPTRFDKKNRSLARYVAELIGHEAKGSILSYLKAEGLAHSVSTAFQGDSYNEVLDVYIQLTDEGRENYQEVINVVFAYINMLNTNTHPHYINAELQYLQAQAMNTQISRDAGDWVSDISDLMLFTQEDPIIFGYSQDSLSQSDIQDYLQYISPNNMQVFLTTNEIEGETFITPYYETIYSQSIFSTLQTTTWMKASLSELAFPAPNIFISKTTEKQNLGIHKERTFSGEILGLESDALVTIALDERLTLIDKMSLSIMLKAYLETSLGDNDYFAKLAGYRMNFKSDADFIKIVFSGEKSNLMTYLNSVLTEVLNPSISNESFLQAKKKVIFELESKAEDKAFKQAFFNMNLLKFGIMSSDSLISIVESMTLKQYKSLLSNLPDDLFILVPNKGTPPFKNLKKSTPKKTDEKAKITKVVGFPNAGNAAAYSLWLNDNPVFDLAVLSVLNEVIAAPFKAEMRMKRKLAYIADTHLSVDSGISLTFIIESSHHSSKELEIVVKDYLKDQLDSGTLFSDESIKLAKVNALRKLEDNLLREPTNYTLQVLQVGSSLSDYKNCLNQVIKGITKEDLLAILEQ